MLVVKKELDINDESLWLSNISSFSFKLITIPSYNYFSTMTLSFI